MEGGAQPDVEFRSTLRPAIPEDNCHGYQQYIAPGRIRMDAVGCARHGDPRQLWPVLRSGALAGACECASFGRQHDGRRQPQPGQYQPVSSAGGRAGVSKASRQSNAACRCAFQFHDHEQRHRVVFHGTIQSSVTAANTRWQRISHGFQLSTMLQYYSALPFNITTGTNTIQGTAARPTVNGTFISRNSGTGFDFFNVNARVSRTFQIHEHVRLEALVEAFNALNHVNGVTLNGTFGTGGYPGCPLP